MVAVEDLFDRVWARMRTLEQRVAALEKWINEQQQAGGSMTQNEK